MPSLSRSTWREAVQWYEEGWWTDTSVPLLLAAAATEGPATSGVWDREGFHTWREIAERSAAIAEDLTAQGVTPGEVVPVAIADSALAIAAVVAVQAVGAACCPVSHRAGPAEWEHVCELVSARLVLAQSDVELPESLRVTRRDPSIIRAEPGRGLQPLTTEHWSDHVSDIMLTSGTTGRPKGVMNSANTKLCGLRGFVSCFDFTDVDVWACAAPMTHNAGWLYTVLPAMMTRATVVMVPRGDPGQMLQTLIEKRATVAFLVPTHVEDLHREVMRTSAVSQLALRHVLTGAAPASTQTLREVLETWGTNIISLYGLTECQAILFTRVGDDVDIITTTVGRPCPGSEVDLRDPADPMRVSDPGEVGELVTRGPTTFLGYLDNEAATFATFTPDGWLRTGDLGVKVGDSYRIVGRLKEVILRGGATLSPQEIAEAIAEVLAGPDVCVVGIPDARLGEKVCAVIEGGEPVEVAAVRDLLRAAGFGNRVYPDLVETLAEFPRTDLGKIRSGEVKKTLLARLGQ